MARQKLIVRNKCPICGDYVEIVPDNILKKQPGYNNAEFVVTHSGYKQYIHSSCWYGMIEEQKRRNGLKQTGAEQKKKKQVERDLA